MTLLVALVNKMTLKDGSLMINKYYYQGPASVANTEWPDVVEDMAFIALSYNTVWQPEQAQTISWVGGDVFEVDTDTRDETLRGSFTLVGAGGNNAGSANNTDSLTVKVASVGGGRPARKSIGGIVGNQLIVNDWNANVVAVGLAYGLLWATVWIGPQTAFSWTPVLYSRKFGSFNPLLASVEVNSVAGTMNTRKKGRGV